MTGEIILSLWRGLSVSAEQTDTAHFFIQYVQRSLSRALSIMYFKPIKTNIPLAATSNTVRMKSKMSVMLFLLGG